MMKVAIVTGALGGIGNACARMLAEGGYDVVGMGRSEKAWEGDFPMTYLSGDVACAEDRARLVRAAKERGRIEVLVNAAGVAPRVRADLLEMTEESYDAVMAINTKGLLFLTQAVAKEMLAQTPVSGAIVNISSCSAYTSSVSRGEYCVSKAGVSMITRLFADRLAGSGITVNEVCPGIIHTGMTKAVEAKYDALIEGGLVPQGRWGEPEDVARAVMVLCDGTLRYTTGASLLVDGGMHIRSL